MKKAADVHLKSMVFHLCQRGDMKLELFSKDLLQTEEIAKAFAAILKPGNVVGFSGDLGAGKTTFIKEIAAYFGIDKDEVTSTSFVLAREYEGTVPFLHADVYRLDCLEEIPVEVSEFIDSQRGIVFLEWVENVELTTDYLISLRQERLGERLIEIQGPREFVAELESSVERFILKL